MLERPDEARGLADLLGLRPLFAARQRVTTPISHVGSGAAAAYAPSVSKVASRFVFFATLLIACSSKRASLSSLGKPCQSKNDCDQTFLECLPVSTHFLVDDAGTCTAARCTVPCFDDGANPGYCEQVTEFVPGDPVPMCVPSGCGDARVCAP
jgi:hypothetical protein